MADSAKRTTWALDGASQNRVRFYLFQAAMAVLQDINVAEASRALALRVYGGSVNLFAACMIVANNADIGALIDAGSEIPEASIQWVILTDQRANMAAAGV